MWGVYRKRAAFVVGVLLAIGFVWQAPAVFAADGYPYAAKPCIWTPYATNGTAANWCPDYDWGDVPDSEIAASVISPYGYYYRNCTDYTAWKMSALGVPPAMYMGLGNAKDWASNAVRKGMRADGVPAAGAVAVRTDGRYGHTAYIRAVHSDGTLLVEQYNYHGDGNYSEQLGTPADFGFVAFIHFEDLFLPAVPAPAFVADQDASQFPAEEQVDPSVTTNTVMVDGELAALEVDSESAPPEQTAQAEQVLAEAVTAQPPEQQPEVSGTPVVAPAPQPPAVHELAAASVAAAPPQAVPAFSTPAPALVWSRAVHSPPLAAPATLEPQSFKDIQQPADVAISYWPLIGLLCVLLACDSLLRKAHT